MKSVCHRFLKTELTKFFLCSFCFIFVLLLLQKQVFSKELQSPPNIVFIMADDLGQHQVGAYGSSFYETPHIDGLAKNGMKFLSAYAACPVCSPTRASIMTGKYPARLHITDYIPGKAPKKKLKTPDWQNHFPFQK